MARVSVVIPAYNAERTLGATIDSVLGQTFRDIEVVVVDDGSADRTAAQAASYGTPVRVITTPNQGVAQARNTGIDEAVGEFVAFLDADDLWLPDKVERQVALLDSRPAAGVSTTGHMRVRDDTLEPLAHVPAEDPADVCATLLLRSQVAGNLSTPIVRRDLATATRFDPRFSQSADWDFFLRLALATEFAVIPDPLILYRASATSMSTDIALLERDTFAVLDAFFSRDVPHRYRRLRRRIYSNHWMIVSGSYLHAGQRKDAVRCLARGVRLHPPNVRRALELPARRLARR